MSYCLNVTTVSIYLFSYDLTIGTSDKGSPIDDMPNKGVTYNHALIVFGGLHGIETALESDEQLQINDVSLLFNHYVNVLPNQGSRTIRTEEAILIALTGLQSKLKPNNAAMIFKSGGIATSSIFAVKKYDNPEVSENNVNLSKFD